MKPVYNPTNNAVVDQAVEWLPIDTCPHGATVLLLTAGNVAVKGQYRRGDNDIKGWFPLPNIPRNMK